MEFRKEKSAKSKELIKIHSKSNIFNIDTGYYKTENIYPISPKPNEIGKRLIEFTPKYKEIKHFQRKFENSLSDQQKRFTNILNLRPNQSIKHMDLEKQRTRNREINGYCFDKKGNFSSKKLYIMDLYGTRDIINNNIKNYFFYNNKNDKSSIKNKSIKDKRKNLFQRNKTGKKMSLLHKQKIMNSNSINNLSINKTNFTIKKTVKEEKDINNKNHRKINNNLNKDIDKINSLIMKLSTNQTKQTINYIKNLIENNNSNNNKNKENNKITKIQNQNVINKSHIIKSKHLKTQAQKESQDYEIYNIEIKNVNKEQAIDEKKIKNILFKNGLHAYNFDVNEGNLFLYENNTIRANLRKMKGDEYFNERIKKVEKILNKNKINLNIKKYCTNYGKKKRKGTPGIELRQKYKIE